MYDWKGLDHAAPADNTPLNQLASFIRESKRAFTGQLLAGQTFEPGVEFGDAVYYDGATSTWRPSIAHPTNILLVDGFALPHLNAVTVSALLHGPWQFEPGVYLYLSDTTAGKLTTQETSYMVGRSLGGGLIVFAAGAALAKIEADKAAGWGKRAEEAALVAESSAATAQLLLDEIRTISDDTIADINTERELAMAELRDLAQTTTTTLVTLYNETEEKVRKMVTEFTTQVTTTGEMYKQLIESTAEFARDSLNNTVTAAVNNLESQSVVFQARLKATGDAQSSRVQALGTQVSGAIVALGTQQKGEVSETGDQYLGEMRELTTLAVAAAAEAKEAADRAVAVAGVDIATPEKAGLVKGGVPGTNVDLASDGTLSVEFDRLVSKPEISVVGTAAIGYTYDITMTAVPLVSDRHIAKFIVTIDSQADVEVSALDNAAIYKWKVAGQNNKTARIKVQAFDNLGYRSDVNYAYVVLKAVTIEQPMITGPTQDEVDVPLFPAISLTAFAITGMPGSAEFTQVQIATTATFDEGTIVFDTGVEKAYTTAVFVDVQLEDDTTFYVRARHSAVFYGWSAWAATVAFKTVLIAIEKPRIMSPANGATSIALTMSLAFTPIATSGINDTGLYTQLQISKNASFTDLYYDSGETLPYALTLAPPQLKPNAQYWARMRHKGSVIGWAEWSDIITFATVVASMVKPSVLTPSEGEEQVGLTPTVTFTGPASSGISDTFNYTQLQLSLTADFAEILYDTGTVSPTTAAVIPSDKLLYNGTYYMRVRHEGAILGWSEWSNTRMFKTIIAKVTKPVVTSPTENQVDVSRTPIILLSAFANVGPVDSPEKTQIQISRLADFSAIVVDTGIVDYMTSYAVPEELRLLSLTRYYVRVRHKGARFDWSDWSDTRIFTTLNQYVAVPLIVLPQNNAEAQPITGMKIKTSAPVTTNDSVTKWEVQLSASASFADVLWQTGQVALPANTEVTIGLTLALTTKYYLRVRYFGVAYGWTVWSDIVTFTTLSAAVKRPTIIAPSNGSSGVNVRPSVTVSNFDFIGPTDTPNGTEIQISSREDFSAIVASYNGAYLTTWASNVQLAMQTPFYVRARHRGVLWGWSEWSITSIFTTFLATLAVPSITAPSNGQSGVSRTPVIDISAAVVTNQVVSSLYVQVSTTADFSNIVWQSGDIADATRVNVGVTLGINANYFVRARRTGSLTGISAWSSPVQFMTLNIYVNPPVLLSPSSGATGVALQPVLTMAAPTAVNQAISGVAFNIAENPDFVPNLHGSGVLSPETRSWTAPPLDINKQYYARAIAEGSVTGRGEGSFGVAVPFRTLNGFVNAPVILEPSESANVFQAYVRLGNFSVFGGVSDTHVATRVILTNHNSGVVVLDKEYAAIYEIDIAPYLERGVSYRVKAFFKGATLGWSAVSVEKLFTVLANSTQFFTVDGYAPRLLLYGTRTLANSDPANVYIDARDSYLMRLESAENKFAIAMLASRGVATSRNDVGEYLHPMAVSTSSTFWDGWAIDTQYAHWGAGFVVINKELTGLNRTINVKNALVGTTSDDKSVIVRQVGDKYIMCSSLYSGSTYRMQAVVFDKNFNVLKALGHKATVRQAVFYTYNFVYDGKLYICTTPFVPSGSRAFNLYTIDTSLIINSVATITFNEIDEFYAWFSFAYFYKGALFIAQEIDGASAVMVSKISVTGDVLQSFKYTVGGANRSAITGSFDVQNEIMYISVQVNANYPGTRTVARLLVINANTFEVIKELEVEDTTYSSYSNFNYSIAACGNNGQVYYLTGSRDHLGRLFVVDTLSDQKVKAEAIKVERITGVTKSALSATKSTLAIPQLNEIWTPRVDTEQSTFTRNNLTFSRVNGVLQ